ncbi:lipocalin family protein [uncultured Hymenobacter sp.]|uniref:lipocalin family protein n=1 Tax=uncultured Hymenobacter sp. TaxID=170016 RepID=UPI0035CAE890
MKHYPLFFSLILLNLLPSCKGKKEDPAPLTPTQLLVGKRWELRSSVDSGPLFGTVDQYAAAPPCVRDNFLQFTEPNTCVYDEGPTLCDPSNPQTELGTWSLANDGTQLTISVGGYTVANTVDELTATSLKLTWTQMQGTTTAVRKNTYVAVP